MIEEIHKDNGYLVADTGKPGVRTKDIILNIFMSRDNQTDYNIYAHNLCAYGCSFVTDLDYSICPGNDAVNSNTNKQEPVAACIVEGDICVDGHNGRAILIHHLATKFGKDGFLYASTLLQYLGSQYYQKPRDVYISVPVGKYFEYQDLSSVKADDVAIVKHMKQLMKRQHSAVEFVKKMGFTNIDNNEIYIINDDKSQHNLCPENHELFKTTTTSLDSCETCQWNSWKTTYIDPSVITTICLCRKGTDIEQLNVVQ